MEDVRPDRSFMKQLHSLDKRLGVKFNGTHFVITCTTERYGEVNIWQVVAEDGGFRQPDQRELEMLRESHIERISPNERFNLVTAYMEKFDSDQVRARKENIRNMTKDGKIQLYNAYNRVAGSGKSNATFRRIER